MDALTYVRSHNEVNSGDVLLHIELEHETSVFRVRTAEWIPTLLHVVQNWVTESVPVTIKLVKYDSPLKQIVLKKIKIN